jgi:hypothetical protein
MVSFTFKINLDKFTEKNNNITICADSNDFYKEYNEDDNCYSKNVVISKNLQSNLQSNLQFFINIIEKIIKFIDKSKIFYNLI